MTLYRIDLPWSCAESSNKRDRYGHGGGYTLARDETHAEATNQIEAEPFEGPVRVRMDVFPPEDPGPLELSPPFDVTNLQKAILDGLEGAAYENDRQVAIGMTYQREPRGAGGIIVQVEDLPHEVEEYIVSGEAP